MTQFELSAPIFAKRWVSFTNDEGLTFCAQDLTEDEYHQLLVRKDSGEATVGELGEKLIKRLQAKTTGKIGYTPKETKALTPKVLDASKAFNTVVLAVYPTGRVKYQQGEEVLYGLTSDVALTKALTAFTEASISKEP